MRGELPQTMALDLSASIAAAIELEPAIVSPQAKAPIGVTEQVTTDKNRVVPLFKQFGQYAIAATVAMFAIVGVQNVNQTADDAASPSPVLVTRPLVGSASPVSLQTGPVQQNQSYTNDQMNEQRRRINTYIQDHMLQQRLNTGAVVEDNSEVIPVPVNQ